MEYVISAVIAIAMLSVFLFISLRGIVKRVNYNAKKYFLEKIQGYNYLIDEKTVEVEKLSNQLESMKEKYQEYQDTDEKLKRIEELYRKVQEDRQITPKVEVIQAPQYKEENFFKDYKQLKQKFDVNGEKILKAFIKEHPGEKDDKMYKKYDKVLSKFTPDFIYSIITSNEKERYQKVEKILTPAEKKLISFENYQENNFNILDLVKDIKEEAAKCDPTIYVYTSTVGINYDYLDDRICTKTYANMSEGIMIEYQNNLYDYSI